MCKLIGNEELYWLSAALVVSVSIVCMQATKTLPPPGGATSLIANIGSEKIKSLGYFIYSIRFSAECLYYLWSP